jgi:hypothetical protein
VKYDAVLSTPALHGSQMQFRARVFERPPLTVALLTDLGNENPGCSITNGIEYAVAAVLEKWPDIHPARLVVVEHYDDRERRRQVASRYHGEHTLLGREHGESFDLVAFGVSLEALGERLRQNSRQSVGPTWKHTTKAMVEQLVGEELP